MNYNRKPAGILGYGLQELIARKPIGHEEDEGQMLPSARPETHRPRHPLDTAVAELISLGRVLRSWQKPRAHDKIIADRLDWSLGPGSGTDLNLIGQLLAIAGESGHPDGAEASKLLRMTAHRADSERPTKTSSGHVGRSSPSASSANHLPTFPVDPGQSGKVIVTSNYGLRDPEIPRASKDHQGTDFRAFKGAPIYATEDGTVAAAGKIGTGGNSIIISNDSGSMSGHAHTAPMTGISTGKKVKRGQQIGTSDGSGVGDHPHQHYTYRPGTQQSPATLRSPKADPLKTQYKNRDKEHCFKGTPGCN